MKTSRFKNISSLPRAYTPISISRFPPAWYVGKQYQSLAPSPNLLKDTRLNNYSREQYYNRFELEVLSQLDPEVVYNDLHKLGNEPVLLCFEDLTIPGEWCHRRMVAEWFEDTFNITVPEFNPKINRNSTLTF